MFINVCKAVCAARQNATAENARSCVETEPSAQAREVQSSLPFQRRAEAEQAALGVRNHHVQEAHAVAGNNQPDTWSCPRSKLGCAFSHFQVFKFSQGTSERRAETC